MAATDGAGEFEQSVARLSESWMALFGMGPGDQQAPNSQRPGIADEVAQMQRNMLGFATAFTEPFTLFVESQHELSKQVTKWAESQRDLAEIAAAWAQSQRKLSDLLASWVTPRSPGQQDA
jgi:hypothetical protein